MMKFYDTCSLLLKVEDLFSEGKFAISSITLEELEGIKTSAHKDAETKYHARKILSQLADNPKEYEVWIFRDYMLGPIKEKGFESINNDLKILSCAINYDKEVHPDDTIFVTNDLALYNIANLFFGEDSIESVKIEDDGYCGYKIINLDDQQMEELYSRPDFNMFDNMINEYLVICDTAGTPVDRLCWTGDGYRHLSYSDFSSKWFGKVKPLKNDIYQSLAADSLVNNRITMLKGPAGSGKTYLSLSFLLNRLEKGEIDKIIIFCNTVATKNSAKLGFYPGTRDEKLLDSQIGNLLSSKFGGRIIVEQMINEEKLILLPMSDIRGYDTTGMRAGIYISEAQNLDITLMKLALQRIGEDSICIIDGDDKTQVDLVEFAGENNGMKRVSKVFRGSNIYGEIELKNIHRSRIAQLAELM